MKHSAFLFVAIVTLAPLSLASAQQRAACEGLSSLSQPTTAITLARTIASSADLELAMSIHFRSDLEVGKVHAQRIGGYTVSFARIDGADLR
jgi:hypothetical protein